MLWLCLQFAVQLLNLAILAQDKDASSPFHICGIVIPKLVSSGKQKTDSNH